VSMTGNIDRVEVITSVQRRRRWSAEEKARIVQETYAPGMSVSLVARQHGGVPNQVFTWRRLYAEGALSTVGAGEKVVLHAGRGDRRLTTTRNPGMSVEGFTAPRNAAINGLRPRHVRVGLSAISGGKRHKSRFR
jgi:transposase-like protein